MRTLSQATAMATTALERAGRILVFDTDEGVARTVGAVLRHDGYQVSTVASLYDMLVRLREAEFDILLIELRSEDLSGEEIFARLGELAPDAAVIVLTRYASFELALRALRFGAYDYVVKPVDVDELRVTIERGLQHRRLRHELAARVRELEVLHTQAQGFNTRLREQVDTATAELRSKVDALDESNAHLRQTQEEHERFVAMVAHEMRGPLNPIINYAQLVKRPSLTAQQVDSYTDIIIEHAFRLNRLVDDLQTATRLSTDHFTLHLAPADIAAEVSEVVEHFTSTVRERRFSLQRPDGPVTAEVDRDRVVQAVRNLIDNAVKYSAEDGAVEVSVWSDQTHAYVRVRDYGAGIPEEQMARNFEAFTRLDKRPDISGSGLGLYITRGIVAAHGGELSVRNGTGTERARGAIFTMCLPLHAPAHSEQSAPAPQS
jgi:signal transduction histidine kinase